MMAPSRVSAALLVATAGVGWLAPAALSQIPDDLPSTPPVSMGPVQLYPIYSADLQWTSNLFYRTTEQTSTTIATISPGIIVALPFSQSRARVAYRYRYSDYASGEIPGNHSHFLSADTQLAFSNGILLGLSEDLERGVLDTESLDPDGAVTFRGQRFQTNSAAVEIGHSRSASRSLALSLRRESLRFLGEGSSGFFDDVDGNLIILSGGQRIGTRFLARWEILHGRASLIRPGDERIQITDETAIGGRWALNPGTSMDFKVGWEREETQREEFPSEDKLVTGSVSFERAVPAGATFTASLSRSVAPLVQAESNTYVTNRLRLEVHNDSAARLALGCKMGYSQSRLPSAEDDRVRQGWRTWDAEAWIGYRFSGWLEWLFSAGGSWRSSAIRGFEYDVKRIGTTFRLVG